MTGAASLEALSVCRRCCAMSRLEGATSFAAWTALCRCCSLVHNFEDTCRTASCTASPGHQWTTRPKACTQIPAVVADGAYTVDALVTAGKRVKAAVTLLQRRDYMPAATLRGVIASSESVMRDAVMEAAGLKPVKVAPVWQECSVEELRSTVAGRLRKEASVLLPRA